jgi:hypothetical protein
MGVDSDITTGFVLWRYGAVSQGEVILFPFGGIRKSRVSLVKLPHFFIGVRTHLIPVRMVLKSELTIRLINLFSIGIRCNA